MKRRGMSVRIVRYVVEAKDLCLSFDPISVSSRRTYHCVNGCTFGGSGGSSPTLKGTMRTFRVVAATRFMWTASFCMPMLGVCPDGFGEEGSGRASITENCASGGEQIEQ